MQDQRRLDITRWNKVGKAIVPTHGHLIGSGPRSLQSIHRKVAQDLLRQMKRRAEGRFVWWPNLGSGPLPFTPSDTRQYTRQTERDKAKAYAHRNFKRTANWRLALLYPELVNAAS